MSLHPQPVFDKRATEPCPAGSDGPPPNVEIALVAEDVDAAYQVAVDAGCEPLAAPVDKPQGQRAGWVRDPFGLLVELATPL